MHHWYFDFDLGKITIIIIIRVKYVFGPSNLSEFYN